MDKTRTFAALNLMPELLSSLSDLGYVEMTPIQVQSIPVLLAEKDLVGRAQTGSGKTAAFILPILQRLKIAQNAPQALIMCPTRELCEQVLREARKFSNKLKGVRSVAIVGGQPYPPQLQALEQGVHLVVGTPGRILELLNSNRLNVRNLKTLVLDEADRMLDDGFYDQVTKIMDALPPTRQTVFFSATYPESIEQLSLKYQKNAVIVAIENLAETRPSIDHFVYMAENSEKRDKLLRILKQHPSENTLIFCRTKESVREVNQVLARFKVASRALHGDLDQAERDQAMLMFRNGSLRILVATDIAARGLDIERLGLVINFDLPVSAEIYVHRVGRTARAGKSGVAVSMANEFETERLAEIEKIIQAQLIRGELKLADEPGLAFQVPKMKTIMVAGGKKDKLARGDLLGAMTAKPDALEATKIGKIELFERSTFVAVAFDQAHRALAKLQATKIKGAKFKGYFVEP